MGWKSAPRWDKSNRVWRVQVRGKMHYLGRCDETEAHARWAKLRRNLVLGDDAPPGPPTVAEAIALWIDLHPSKRRQWRVEVLAPWFRFAGAELVEDLDADHLIRFKNHLVSTGYVRRRRGGVHIDGSPKYVDERRPYSPQSLRHFIRHTVSVLKWCEHRGWLSRTPSSPALPRTVKKRRDYTPEELSQAIERLSPAQARIIRFILETGCRPKEARELRWEDVDLRLRRCNLDAHKTAERTGETRRIRLTQEALGALKEIPNCDRIGHVFKNLYGRPWTQAGLRSAMRRAGLNSVYGLRHTRAQDMLRQGIPIEVVAKWLGHKGLRTVLTYAEAEDKTLDQVARGLASPLPRKRG